MSYSLDLREKVIKYVKRNNNMLEASREFEIGYETVRNWMRAYYYENRLAPKEAYRQEPYKLNWEELRDFVKENPDWYQVEYAAYFNVSGTQIGRVLKKLGITRKKKSLTYQEQDEKKVIKFKEDLKKMIEEQEEKLGHPPALVYIDECAIKEEVTRPYGYAEKGEKIQGKTQGKRPHKINMVAALSGQEILAPFTFEGTMNADLFNAYLCYVLLPLVAIGAIIIMDNARYHLSEETRELIEEKGCRLIYLSPYSPELNRIEKYWGILKRYIQRFRCFFSSLEDTLFFIFNTFKPFRTLLGV